MKAYLKPHVGLGDTLMLTIGIKELIAMGYDEIFICTPHKMILEHIPQLRFVNAELRENNPLMAVPEDCNLKELPHFQAWLAANRVHGGYHTDTYDPSLITHHANMNGDGYRIGNWIQEQCIAGEVAERLKASDKKHRMDFNAKGRYFNNYASWWFDQMGIDPKKAILFHSQWRPWEYDETNHECRLATRVARDKYMIKAKEILERRGYFLFDTEFPWPVTTGLFPKMLTFPTYGYYGFWSMMAIIRQVRAVVLQSTCRLLPMAQHEQKPILCFNQGGYNVGHYNWPKLDAPMFIECEPRDFHRCGQAVCDICEKREITDLQIEEAVDTMLLMQAN